MVILFVGEPVSGAPKVGPKNLSEIKLNTWKTLIWNQNDVQKGGPHQKGLPKWHPQMTETKENVDFYSVLSSPKWSPTDIQK